MFYNIRNLASVGAKLQYGNDQQGLSIN